jgi:hypothetical protein
MPYYTGSFLMGFFVVYFLVGFLMGFLVGFFVGFLIGFAASRLGTPPGMRVAQLGSSSPPSISVLMQVFHVPTPVLALQQPSTVLHMPPRFGTAKEISKPACTPPQAVRTCSCRASTWSRCPVAGSRGGCICHWNHQSPWMRGSRW